MLPAKIQEDLYKFVKIFCRLFIAAYQYFLSPFLLPFCRFQPSCSCYAKEAFGKYGFRKGIRLTFYRLLRCHPWGGNGYDPIP